MEYIEVRIQSEEAIQAKTMPAPSVFKVRSMPPAIVQSRDIYTSPERTAGTIENTIPAIMTEAAMVIDSPHVGLHAVSENRISKAAIRAVPTARAGLRLCIIMKEPPPLWQVRGCLPLYKN